MFKKLKIGNLVFVLFSLNSYDKIKFINLIFIYYPVPTYFKLYLLFLAIYKII